MSARRSPLLKPGLAGPAQRQKEFLLTRPLDYGGSTLGLVERAQIRDSTPSILGELCASTINCFETNGARNPVPALLALAGEASAVWQKPRPVLPQWTLRAFPWEDVPASKIWPDSVPDAARFASF
jgi:hypothetical protein